MGLVKLCDGVILPLGILDQSSERLLRLRELPGNFCDVTRLKGDCPGTINEDCYSSIEQITFEGPGNSVGQKVYME